MQRDPQNYAVRPEQPWLDGFAVAKGVIRQFIAMPLGAGYSAEEQLTGNAHVGGIQLQVFPMRADAFFKKHLEGRLPSQLEDILEDLLFRDGDQLGGVLYELCACAGGSAMGIGAGGTMQQEIYSDRNDFADWDSGVSSRCFVHLCNSEHWRAITGSNPPHPPITAKDYKQAGIPWFDYYRDDCAPLNGSTILAGLNSVVQIGKAKDELPFSANDTVTPDYIIQYGNTRRPEEVREWAE